jgi:hypothetical protein
MENKPAVLELIELWETITNTKITEGNDKKEMEK